MTLERVPRWALTLLLLGASGLAGTCVSVLFSRAEAQIQANITDIQATRAVADRALVVAEQAQMQYAELRGAVQELKISNETFRKEYREDNKDLQRALSDLSRKIN